MYIDKGTINLLKTKQKQIKAYEFNNPSLYITYNYAVRK